MSILPRMIAAIVLLTFVSHTLAQADGEDLEFLWELQKRVPPISISATYPSDFPSLLSEDIIEGLAYTPADQAAGFFDQTLKLVRVYFPGVLSDKFSLSGLFQPAKKQLNPEAYAVFEAVDTIVVGHASVRKDFGAPGNERIRQDQLRLWAWPRGAATEISIEERWQDDFDPRSWQDARNVLKRAFSFDLPDETKHWTDTDGNCLFYSELPRESNDMGSGFIKGVIGENWATVWLVYGNWFSEGNRRRKSTSLRPISKNEIGPFPDSYTGDYFDADGNFKGFGDSTSAKESDSAAP